MTSQEQLTLEVRNLDNRMAYMLGELRRYGITKSDGAAGDAGPQRGISRTSEIQPARAGAGSWAEAQTVLGGVAPTPSDPSTEQKAA